MEINLDFSSLLDLASLPIGTALFRLFFWYFGWLPVAIISLWGLIQFWLIERREAWEHHQKFILLAIDVPRNNEQSLLAVENLITYFAGAHGGFTLVEKWWDGKFQLPFSLEIVSLGGYIQFLIHTPAKFKSLVESAIYSQYPDAEVYEVEDYVTTAPDRFPDEDYDIWGAEFIQTAHEALPIKTWPQFEHDFGESNTKFRDPMASLMDLMSSLRKGEQLWYQIILVPTSTAWTKEAQHFIDEKLGKGHEVTKANNVVDKLISWMGDLSEAIYPLWGDIPDKKEEKKNLMFMELDPLKKAQVEAAHRKMSKMGFEVSMRMLYVSRKEVMNSAKVVNGFVGYIKQFNTNDLNGLKPDVKMTMTSASYFFTKSRIRDKKNSIMRGYKMRSENIGRKPWILNVEELATLWHFPIDAVTKAPLMQRAVAKRIEPPMTTPFEESEKKRFVKDEIFEPGYVIKDENTESEKALETEITKTERTSSTRPAFFEDADEETTEEAEVIQSSKKAEKTPSDLTSAEVVSSISEKPIKGAPPSNLPLG